MKERLLLSWRSRKQAARYKKPSSNSRNPPVSVWIQAERRGRVIHRRLDWGEGTEVINKVIYTQTHIQYIVITWWWGHCQFSVMKVAENKKETESKGTRGCKVQETSDTGMKWRAGLLGKEMTLCKCMSCNMLTFNIIITPERPR